MVYITYDYVNLGLFLCIKGRHIVKIFSKAVKLLFLNSFIIGECNKESLLFTLLPHTHSCIANTLTDAHIPRCWSMTYYCPLVAPASTASQLSISINFLHFHSPDFLLSLPSTPPPHFPSLTLLPSSLPYHTQTFKRG